jgi:ABC-2 type transport system ATP-binding protein
VKPDALPAATQVEGVATQAVPPTAVPAVSIQGLSRVFGERTVIENLDLRVDEGEVHALIGPNGAGKTTLLRIIAGLLAPSAGRVEVMGQAATDSLTRSRIGWVPAGDRTFYLRISGRENLRLFARLYGLSARRARSTVDELIQALDLVEAADRPASQYSQGMLKRLGVARALLAEPRLLLFDEATHDLDPDGAQTVREMVRRMAADGVAVVWATQRLEELPGLADTVSVLQHGGAPFQGTVDRLLAEASVRSFVVRTAVPAGPPALEAIRARLGPRSSLEGTGSGLVLELAEDDHLGAVIGMLEAQGITVRSCAEKEAEIRLAFRTVTGR